MKLHIVGGFLGSGKTTAITNASKLLMRQGSKVAVVTNDQGKYLVDSSFMVANHIPSAEVTNGCFCCNFNSLSSKIELLEREIKPETIFAESVGSCTDLVATVLKPLKLLKKELFNELTFSVFTDCRLFSDYLHGKKLPFSNDISYIFSKQIEEADLLVINKIDLMPEADFDELRNLVAVQFSKKKVILQNSLDDQNIQNWLDILSKLPDPHCISLSIDYQTYGKGEADLAWLDEEINIHTEDQSAWNQAIKLIDHLIAEIKQNRVNIGHLKFMLKGEGFDEKISFTTIADENWKRHFPVRNVDNLRMMVNARIETTPEEARRLVRNSVFAISGNGVLVTESKEDAFQPGFPNPTHRIENE